MRNYAVIKDDLRDDLGNLESFLTSDMELEAANRLWLSNSFWKKFQDELESTADDACLALFIESDNRCASYELKPTALFEEELIGEVKNQFERIFFRGPDRRLTLQGILRGTGVGPGASIGAGSSDFYTKLFNSTLSSTSVALHKLYLSSIAHCPSWLSAEHARQNKLGVEIVEGNRLSFVPKTAKISRGICTEPVLNMFFQKGIGSVFEDLLEDEFKISLSKQPIFNRQLAQRGSVDGAFGTIDLQSASDSISLKLLKQVLPLYVYQWLCLARSPCVTLPDGSTRELNMVSSMGNGFTFPLQTLLFATIVTSCYRVLGLRPRYGPDRPLNFSVFGDDIIVRKDSYDFVIRALELFGFRVNGDKSFNTGLFRESCGGDYFRGQNIRGVYCKSLKTRSDVYSILNRLVRWSARTGVLLPKTVARLMSWVKYMPVPYSAGDAEGIKVPRAPDHLARNKNGSVVYHALVQVKESIVVPNSSAEKWRYPRRLDRRTQNAFYNAEGIFQTLLGGYIRSPNITGGDRCGRIGIRSSDTSRTKIQRCITHNWSDAYMVESSTQDDDWFVIVDLYEQLLTEKPLS